eukprot:NODE_4649_length_781_cov_24.319672_g4305_i0.p1 GENE.NODE_4649_length_781_cov_24.319672_g4305_i0~~NODE_4649_length_781_cov_24.319672_g4305_i0.p1  ORF type:complete len:234 (+),score=39.36 NODE_4649_length_781_cov_24.319672_g4305_i0:61-702(+)
MTEVYRMFRVHKTLYEMLADRGYLVDDQDRNLTMARFREEKCTREEAGQETLQLKHRSQLWMLHRRMENPSDAIFVFFPDDAKMGVAPVRTFHDRMLQESVSRAIVVTQNPPTPLAKQAMQALRAHNMIFEHFLENELMVNVTKHELVPTHLPLTAAQKAEFLRTNKLRERDLPRIQQADPVTCYFGLEKGQVFKITRKSETAGTYVTYRMVT